MNNVYIVEANFEDFESSWWVVVGIFNNKELAHSHLDKWKSFFEKNQNIFDRPKDFQPKSYTDYGVDDLEEWEESEEFYKLISNYDDIRRYSEMSIREFEVNKDYFIENNKCKSEPMTNILKQWDRDHKIKQITE